MSSNDSLCQRMENLWKYGMEYRHKRKDFDRLWLLKVSGKLNFYISYLKRPIIKTINPTAINKPPNSTWVATAIIIPPIISTKPMPSHLAPVRVILTWACGLSGTERGT